MIGKRVLQDGNVKSQIKNMNVKKENVSKIVKTVNAISCWKTTGHSLS